VDIATFAPLSVKSNQDFHEILAEDNPAVWQTNRPASGGETGAMLRDIIEKAAALKASRQGTNAPAAARARPATGAAAKRRSTATKSRAKKPATRR
jgi:hypothetical protein